MANLPRLRGKPLSSYDPRRAKQYEELLLSDREETKDYALPLVNAQIKDLNALSDQAFESLPSWLVQESFDVYCTYERESWVQLLSSYTPQTTPTPPAPRMLPLIQDRQALVQICPPWWETEEDPRRLVIARPRVEEMPTDSFSQTAQSFSRPKPGWDSPWIEARYTVLGGGAYALRPAGISIPNCRASLVTMRIPNRPGELQIRIGNWVLNQQGAKGTGEWSEPVTVDQLLRSEDAKTAWLHEGEDLFYLPIQYAPQGL